MKPLLPLLHLLAVGTRTTPKVGTTWFVDGNNLMGHRGTCKDSNTLAETLKPIQGAEAVILVLDGRKSGTAETSIDSDGTFQKVSLGEGMSSDDFILHEIATLRDTDHLKRIQVVTADRKLRRLVLDIKPVVRGVVNPVTFWRRYLPRLCGYKKKPKPVDPASSDEEENDTTNE